MAVGAKEVTMVIPATNLVPGDRLRNGKTVSFKIPIDASQTPGITTRLNCTEMAAVGFVGEPLPVLFTDTIRFQVFRRAEPVKKEKKHG